MLVALEPNSLYVDEMLIIKDYRPTSRFVYIGLLDPTAMSRKKHGFWEKLRGSFSAVDQTFSNRTEVNDQTKIRHLEEMMDNNFGFIGEINPHLNKISKRSLKSNLKNSKRY